jgi:hypothetical protein
MAEANLQESWKVLVSSKENKRARKMAVAAATITISRMLVKSLSFRIT